MTYFVLLGWWLEEFATEYPCSCDATFESENDGNRLEGFVHEFAADQHLFASGTASTQSNGHAKFGGG